MDHRVYGPGGVYGSRGVHGLMVVVHEENWGENGPGEVGRPRGRRIYLGIHLVALANNPLQTDLIILLLLLESKSYQSKGKRSSKNKQKYYLSSKSSTRNSSDFLRLLYTSARTPVKWWSYIYIHIFHNVRTFHGLVGPAYGRHWISWRVRIVSPIPKIPHTGDKESLDRCG